MSQQRQLNEVFVDTENFDKPMRLKCVPFRETCDCCAYGFSVCGTTNHLSTLPCGGKKLMFIQTDEPLTTE